MGNCLVAEPGYPQTDCVSLQRCKSCEATLHEFPLFTVQVSLLWIRARARIGCNYCIDIGLGVQEAPPPGPLTIDRQVVRDAKQPLAHLFSFKIFRTMA